MHTIREGLFLPAERAICVFGAPLVDHSTVLSIRSNMSLSQLSREREH
jgi:hypothetical protein